MNVILGIIEKRNDLTSEILSQFNFIIGMFALEPKLGDLYSDSVDTFSQYRPYVQWRQHA